MNLNPGDLIAVHEYTRINPSKFQIGQWIAAQRSGNWWMPKEGEAHNKYRVWPDYPVVVLRTELSVVFVTSSEFPEPLRSEGVRVPLTHVELVQVGYGLPKCERESKVVPMAGRRRKREVAVGQRSLL